MWYYPFKSKCASGENVKRLLGISRQWMIMSTCDCQGGSGTIAPPTTKYITIVPV